ncbi:MAG: restriction endonuclease [Candidatus Thorarchaeota archaeon]
MNDSPRMFEHIIATLLNAEHDVKLPCSYEGESIERQFDGYREIRPDPLTTIKIGIECKKLSRPVEVGEIEKFITKKRDCLIDTAIVVSFTGFQKAAIASAKKSGINLYNFRPSSDDDITRFPFSELIKSDYDFKFNSKASPKSISREERALLSMRDSKYFDNYLYNKDREKAVDGKELVNKLIEPYILEKGYTADILNIDLLDKELYLRAIFGKKELFLRVTSVEIVFHKSIHVKIRNPEDWYILEDVINKKMLLVDNIHVERIRTLYHKE